eukprot:TRINITY_DN21558_c0_g1_i1.p1 TRINITY_DN21558_c0_g1~~TRINITY_DN21558_c0_g1_i1.p1  ORF type:complete len:124 (-),score=29.52 TRINITY_DN21558_c0_g1_i1:169-540(-)
MEQPKVQYRVTNQEAFMELQGKMQDTSKLLQQVGARLNASERERRSSQLTLKELEELPEGVPTYKSVGKMYLISPISSIRSELSEGIMKSETELTNLRNQQKYLANSMNECEKSIKELLVKVE